jgi:hypothetical protein
MPDKETITIESKAFYQLLNELVTLINEKFQLTHRPWVDTDEALQILGIKSKTTLGTLRAEGKIKYSQPMHKVIVYERKSLYEFLEHHAQNTF